LLLFICDERGQQVPVSKLLGCPPAPMMQQHSFRSATLVLLSCFAAYGAQDASAQPLQPGQHVASALTEVTGTPLYVSSCSPLHCKPSTAAKFRSALALLRLSKKLVCKCCSSSAVRWQDARINVLQAATWQCIAVLLLKPAAARPGHAHAGLQRRILGAVAARVAEPCMASTRLVWQQRCSASQAAALTDKGIGATCPGCAGRRPAHQRQHERHACGHGRAALRTPRAPVPGPGIQGQRRVQPALHV